MPGSMRSRWCGRWDAVRVSTAGRLQAVVQAGQPVTATLARLVHDVLLACMLFWLPAPSQGILPRFPSRSTGRAVQMPTASWRAVLATGCRSSQGC